MTVQQHTATMHANGALAAPAVQALAARLHGTLIGPEDAGYDTARKLYNGMIDKYPALIARCADAADVAAAVNFARDHGIILAVRGGGHNGGGLGSVDGGLVIDLAPMRAIRVDPAARTVRVEGGATTGEVDAATHAHGLAVPFGIISSTGVGGLTLGGGLGHLSRPYGLSIDNLLAVELVLADGSAVMASADEHPDLFWAVRGGGGNFGVVTAFHFRAHPVSTVIAGPTLWPLERATEVLRWYRDFLPAAPEELSGFFAFMTVPPVAPFPEALHLQKVCGVVWCYTGPAEEADTVFAPVRALGPALDGLQPMPFPALQSAFDVFHPPGMQWYWRGDFVREISDAAIAEHVRHAAQLPSPQSTMHLYAIDGAASRVGRNDTAFSYREARWAEVIVGVDPDPANAGRIADWAKGYWEALHPYSLGGVYVNFMMEEGQERVRATYRDNYPRLAAIKARYDPTNLFRVNQNIQPAETPGR